MELYYIKYPHQETAKHSEHIFTQNTNTQQVHDKTNVLSSSNHLKFHATQLKQLTQTQTHTSHDLNAHLDLPRNIKSTIFHNNEHINIIISDPYTTNERERDILFSPCTYLKTILDKYRKLQGIHHAKIRKHQKTFKVIKSRCFLMKVAVNYHYQ